MVAAIHVLNYDIFFEVDAKFIVLASLEALVNAGELPKTVLADAMKRYSIDSKKINPMTH